MRQRRSARLALLVICLGALTPPAARADRPADPLLTLVPSDVGVTVVVEDLRTQARTLLDTPLVAEFRRLPAVEEWMASGGQQRFRRARAQVEVALGTTLKTIRDELLGDAVVLALHPGPGPSPDEARGLFLTRAHDATLLRQVIDRLNRLETDDGTLEDLEAATHHGVPYTVRRFAPGTKPDEAYVLLGASTFAWSNSESLIRAVIDRHLGRVDDSIGASPDFQAVRDALPEPSAARLYLDPRVLERSSREDPPDADQDPVGALVARYVAAVRYAGAALVVRDGLFLHTHERLDPAKLDEPLRRWAADTSGEGNPLLARIPADAPIRAAAHVPARPLFDLALGMVPESERPRIEPSLAIARGLLLGLDVTDDVLPALGPGMVAYIDAPGRSAGEGWPPPLVMALAVGGDTDTDTDDPPGVPAALDNALRSILALSTFDSPPGALRVETRERRGLRVTELTGGPVPLAYAVGPGFLALGTSAESVAAFADVPPAAEAGDSPFARFRATYGPDAATFLYIDLDAVGQLAREHREALVRGLAEDQQASVEDVRRDLDRALALLGLFRAAFFTQGIADDFTSVQRTIGLLGHVPQGVDR